MRKLSGIELKTMELKYQGRSYPEIAKEVNKSTSWVAGNFLENGNLKPEYEEYEQQRNTELLEKVKLRDEQVLQICKATMFKYAEGLKNKTAGQITTGDFEKAWKIFRVMCNQPTDYIKSDQTIEEKDPLSELSDEELHKRIKKLLQGRIKAEN